MSTLIDTLTASGGSESAGFLNDIVEQLWPNMTVAAGKILKDVVEPILASTLPGPLSGLHFVKLEFGHVPVRLGNVDVHKMTEQSIKLDVDVDWDGVCDFELEGSLVPKIGIEKAQLKGRLSIMLCPLTNVIPLIGAAQIAFINPPSLKLDFTDAANIADCFLIEKTVRNTILSIINGMLVLPNRILVKLDNNNDFFKTYQPHLGVVRLTVAKATGISAPKKKTGASKLLAKIIKDVPDCYVKINLGAEAEWRTSVQKNDHNPVWDETHDFLVADFEQVISIDIQDDDLGSDDDIGLADTTIKELLLNGGTHELALTHKGEPTDARLTIHATFHHFVADARLLTTDHGARSGEATVSGLVTILIASALGLSGKRDELQPSVQVSWKDKKFTTATKTYTPGTDIFNPSFDQAFTIPLASNLSINSSEDDNFKITLLNNGHESGSVDIPFGDICNAPNMTVKDMFDVGAGAAVRACISIYGIKIAE